MERRGPGRDSRWERGCGNRKGGKSPGSSAPWARRTLSPEDGGASPALWVRPHLHRETRPRSTGGGESAHRDGAPASHTQDGHADGRLASWPRESSRKGTRRTDRPDACPWERRGDGRSWAWGGDRPSVSLPASVPPVTAPPLLPPPIPLLPEGPQLLLLQVSGLRYPSYPGGGAPRPSRGSGGAAKGDGASWAFGNVFETPGRHPRCLLTRKSPASSVCLPQSGEQ